MHVPFAVLPGAHGRPLIERYQFSYVGSGRDILRFPWREVAATNAAIVAADPDFDLDQQTPVKAEHGDAPAPEAGRWTRWLSLFLPRKRPATTQPNSEASEQPAPDPQERPSSAGLQLSFKPLPGTKEEGIRVAGVLNVSPHLGAAVNKGLFLSCRAPRHVHIATRAFFMKLAFDQAGSEDSPRSAKGGPGLVFSDPLMASGLALAGANRRIDQGAQTADAAKGLLTARDIAGLDLTGTRLVVLPACDCISGTARVGWGLCGLQRSFLLAGAQTLVLSLWTAPDQPRLELLEDFYRRVLAGENRADALREAQLSLRRKYPQARNWGAFVCFGNPGPSSIQTAVDQPGTQATGVRPRELPP